MSATAPEERNKFHRMKKRNRQQTRAECRSEIARGRDVLDYRVRFRSDGYFHRTARHPAANRFTVVLFRRSILAGMMRAIFHVCHQIRPALLG